MKNMESWNQAPCHRSARQLQQERRISSQASLRLGLDRNEITLDKVGVKYNTIQVYQWCIPAAFFTKCLFIIYQWQFLQHLPSALQVQAAAKKRAKGKGGDEKSEKAEPKTLLDVAADMMPDMLKDASSARQQSIKLRGVEFAGDLAQKLLTFATDLESLYQNLQVAVNNKDDDEITLVLGETKVKKEAGEKCKAGNWDTLMVSPLMFSA